MPRKKSGNAPSPAASLPPLPDRRLMDQHLAQIDRLLEGRDFATIEEANTFLKQALVGGSPPTFAPRTPLEAAQELVYQALETTGPRRVRLARQALAHSPDCADAYVLLAEATTAPHQARQFYEQGVEAGMRALGPAPFAADVGHFWGIVETRGYMRACQGLAEVLWVLDEREEAIEHAQELLRLNPMDNQGTRYLLAEWLLAVGDDAALMQLLRAYPDEGTATWAYTTALLRFRQHGPGAVATRALKAALETNPYVPFYLLGLWELPDALPAYVGIGDENEAVAYIADALANWVETAGALEWFAALIDRLAEQEERQAATRKRQRSGRRRT
jgi:tetratricopeptide (TPR) repeat protein